jgi:hypothetical protein
MWKKLIGMGLVAVLALALLLGCAYILLHPDEARAQGVQGWREPERAEARWFADDGPRGDGDCTYGYNRERGSQVVGTQPAAEWITLTGEVLAFERDLAIRTADGEMIMHLAPTWYWGTYGISLNPGDRVELSGFYDQDSEFATGRIENLTTGQSVTLRDDTGRPLWTGSRQRGR